MKTKLMILTLSFCAVLSAAAQEFKCHIQIITDQLEGTNKDIYNELSNDLTEFVNSRKWTDATFTEEEKIDCSFVFNLESASGESYKGKLQVTASRPVFNSGYTTSLFNFQDNNLSFQYTQYQKLEWDAWLFLMAMVRFLKSSTV